MGEITEFSDLPNPEAWSHDLTPASARTIPARIPVVKLNGDVASIERAAVRELADSLSGRVLLRGDFGYDGARRVWNGMHDRYPALIVRAQSRPNEPVPAQQQYRALRVIDRPSVCPVSCASPRLFRTAPACRIEASEVVIAASRLRLSLEFLEDAPRSTAPK